MLKPEFEEVQSGVAEIREVFRSSKFGNIAGVIVRSGTITRNAKARVIRDGVVVGDNLAIESLRRFKTWRRMLVYLPSTGFVKDSSSRRMQFRRFTCDRRMRS